MSQPHGETLRILQLPEVSRDFYRGCVEHYGLDTGVGKLWDAQRCALAALAIFGGVAAQMGCGDGKTLVSVLGATICNAQRPVILIPGKLRDDFYKQWNDYARLGFKLPNNLQVKAHDFVSRHSTWLEDYKPDYLFIDEAHAYRRIEAARTRRLLRFLDKNPTKPNGGDLVFGVASGTLAATTVLDFAHLLTHALGKNCPVPRRWKADQISSQLAAWAMCLDVDGRPSQLDWRVMRPLVEAHAPDWLQNFDRGDNAQKRYACRQAYDARRRNVPGIIASDSESVTASLTIETSKAPAPPPAIVEALRMVKSGYSPDGDEAFPDDHSAWRAAQQVSIGVYYRWAWERTPLGRRDEEWIDARKAWNRAVRYELSDNAAANYDSPGLIFDQVERDLVAVSRFGAAYVSEREHLYQPFLRWYPMRDRYNPDELREHVWLDDWYVRHVVAQARASKVPVIVWWQSEAMASALRAAGLPVYGAGEAAPTRAVTCGLSLRRFGTGANLQDRWSAMHYAEFPSSGEKAEQSLARLHRPGQIADEVVARVYVHTDAFAQNFQRARQKAAFIDPMQGRQRLSFVPIVPLAA